MKIGVLVWACDLAAINKIKIAAFIKSLIDFGAGSNSVAVPHPTFTKGIAMNAREILNADLRQTVAGMSLKEIREFHLQMEQDVFELRTFLKISESKKPSCSRPSRDVWRGRLN